MAAPLGKGDWVRCVQNRQPHTAPPIGLVVGSVYQVESVGFTSPDDENPNVPWVRVLGARVRPEKLGFRLSWFEPVYRLDANLIASLKAPPINTPARVGEDA